MVSKSGRVFSSLAMMSTRTSSSTSLELYTFMAGRTVPKRLQLSNATPFTNPKSFQSNVGIMRVFSMIQKISRSYAEEQIHS